MTVLRYPIAQRNIIELLAIVLCLDGTYSKDNKYIPVYPKYIPMPAGEFNNLNGRVLTGSLHRQNDRKFGNFDVLSGRSL